MVSRSEALSWCTSDTHCWLHSRLWETPEEEFPPAGVRIWQSEWLLECLHSQTQATFRATLKPRDSLHLREVLP